MSKFTSSSFYVGLHCCCYFDDQVLDFLRGDIQPPLSTSSKDNQDEEEENEDNEKASDTHGSYKVEDFF